ncbi:MAG: ABC transporter permease subunit, partial [Ilumatobacteraceae bacterium]
MNTIAVASPRSSRQRLVIGSGVVAALLVAAQVIGSASFPSNWYAHLADPINDWQGWLRTNRTTHWSFTVFINPLTDLVDFLLTFVEDFFTWLPWFIPPIVVFLVIARRKRWVMATCAALAVIYPGVVGVWEQSIETIALMTVSVAISVILGIPLGVWTALNKRAESILRPILDAMQTVPATVYLIPIVLLFGIGKVPAAIATVIYALPPMVRLTALGIQQVPRSAVEASQMFGATRRQTLARVEMPLAVPSIVTGINQTVMMALGIVVIATLVGAGGLGQEINQTVRALSPGKGLVVSLAVVAVAFVLDRVSLALVTTPGAKVASLTRRQLLLIVIALLIATIIGRLFGWVEFPFSWGKFFANPIDDFVLWFRDTFSFITRPFNDFIVRDVLIRTRSLFNTTLAWQLIVIAAAAFSYVAAGWKMAIATTIGLVVIGLSGMWYDASETLAQTVVAVVLSIVIAVPVGVWLGRRPKVETAISPILDS